MHTLLYNATFFTGRELVSDSSLLTHDGIIDGFASRHAIPEDAQLIDCRGLIVAAGLIDLQIAGSGGYLFSATPDAKALQAITRAITGTGTAGFLIAMPTNTMDVYREAFRTIRENSPPAVLGLHLEGPYISQARRGAHARKLIRKPSLEDLSSLLEEGGDVIRMMTVAPEVCSPEIISLIRDHGITVSAGHSNASFREASDGFRNGIESTTHLFNAMSPMHHRDPGLPGAAFNSDRACASIIADGIHVDYSMLAVAKKVMNERLFLVSDAVEENDRGEYRHVRQQDRFTLPDGTLSGSSLTLIGAVRNCVRHAGIDKYEALRMASFYPAQLIRASDRGVITPGARADLIVLNDDLDLEGIFTEGSMKFRKA
jgi:N-acetylglucosamine-6-phosphate deacetylase